MSDLKQKRLVPLVKQGDPVSPGTVNQPLRGMQGNLQWLYELVEAAALGSTLFARDVTLDETVVPGTPVYFDSTTQSFRPALASASVDPSSGVVSTAPQAQTWGIVYKKSKATLGDILLSGFVEFDISGVVGEDLVDGAYYLSGQQAGRLVHQQPPVSVAVLRRAGKMIYVNPPLGDVLEGHKHYKFELWPAPAGEHTAPDPGDRHVITNPNPAWPGWLPADHDVFEGKAPYGAVFGYNLKANEALDAAWPPVPLTSAYVELDRGDRSVGGCGVPLGPGGLCQLTRDGIWWMSDCEGDVPWDKDLAIGAWNAGDPPPTLPALEASEPPECPRATELLCTLWFTRVTFATENVVVTSLASRDNRLKVYCAGTDKLGFSGDLELDLDLGLTVGPEKIRRPHAFTTLEDDTLYLGSVASGIYTTSPGVQIVSEAQTPLDPLDPDGTALHHGVIKLDLIPEAVRELSAQLIRLDGATEEHIPILYLGLPDNIPTSFVAKFEIPSDAPAAVEFTYRARLIGRAAGTLPPLSVGYNVARRPEAGQEVVVDNTYAPMTIDTEATLLQPNATVEAESAPVTLQAGDIVYVQVTRTPADASDAYASEVGVVQQSGILTVPSA